MAPLSPVRTTRFSGPFLIRAFFYLSDVGLGDIITKKRNRLVDNTARALLLVKNWIGQPDVEACEIEELEEEWVDEGVWAEEAAEAFGRRMFLCNICSRARDVPGLRRDESQKPGNARQNPPRDEQNEIFSRSRPVPCPSLDLNHKDICTEPTERLNPIPTLKSPLFLPFREYDCTLGGGKAGRCTVELRHASIVPRVDFNGAMG
jgi:hypothetical protein